MPLSILFSSRNQNRVNNIDSLEIEATLSENHQATSEVTRQPVEDGSTIADHIINQPESISIEGFVSNTPISGGFFNNAQNTFDELYRIREDKRLVTVVTGYKVYSDMAITSISIPRDRSTGQAIRFNVELVKVKKTGSASVGLFEAVLGAVGSAIADQASSSLNLGRQIARPASQAAGEAARDLARRIL